MDSSHRHQENSINHSACTAFGKMDLEELMEKFIILKRNKNQLLVGNEEKSPDLGKLWKSILISFADHVLYQMQLIHSPKLLGEIFNISQSTDNWLENHLLSMGLGKTATRHLLKFVSQWIVIIEHVEQLLMSGLVLSVYICFGQSLQRISKSFCLSLHHVNMEAILYNWVQLSAFQRQEFSKAVGRMIVRNFLQLSTPICSNENSASYSNNHVSRDRSFVCVETSCAQSDEAVLMTNVSAESTIWEYFHSISGEIFIPRPKLKKKSRIRRIKRDVKGNSAKKTNLNTAILDENNNGNNDLTPSTAIETSKQSEIHPMEEDFPISDQDFSQSFVLQFSPLTNNKDMLSEGQQHVWLVSKGIKAIR